MKILRVTSNIYPEVNGGLELHTHHMSRIQSEMGHDVTVLTSDNGDEHLPRKEKRDGYKIIRFHEWMKPIDNSIIPGLIKYLLKYGNEYDIIHTHSHLFFSSNITTQLGNLLNPPVVLTNHGLTSQTASSILQTIYNFSLGRMTFNSADVVFCYTEGAKNKLMENKVKTKIKVISNGINCDFFKPNQEENKKFQLLYVGRLKPLKGLEYLIDAFAIVNKRYPKSTLKIIGDGPMKKNLKNQGEELGVLENIIFEGNVKYEEMPNHYNQSTILISPTLTEAGVPRVVLEAWGCEIPAIVSDIPEIRTNVEIGGLTFSPKSKNELANKIIKLLKNDGMREKLGKRGREKVKNEFSWQETVEKTTDTYHEMI